MANTKSAKKDLRRSEKRRVQNQAIKSALKTYVKKARTAAATGDVAATTEALRIAEKMLDKAAQNGVIHKNQAARRKSRIAQAVVAKSGEAPKVPVAAKASTKAKAPAKGKAKAAPAKAKAPAKAPAAAKSKKAAAPKPEA